MALASDLSYTEAELFWNVKCLLLHALLYPIFSTIWHLAPHIPRRKSAVPPPKQAEPQPRPGPAVLALGPVDADTEVLRLALKELGFASSPRRPDASAILLARKLACRLPRQVFAPALPGTPGELRAQLDPVFGACTAAAGQQAAVLAPELARAYPRAKVVLPQGRRGGARAWAGRVGREVREARRWAPWLLGLLSCRRFWRGQTARLLWLAHFYGDDVENRRRWYAEHFRQMGALLKGREVLEWCEEDGWEPLCAFLGKEVPSKAFPYIEKVTDAEARRQRLRVLARYTRAVLNTFALAGSVFAAGVVVGVNWVPWRSC